MKTIKYIACGTVATLFALPLMAEPRSFSMLSVHADRDAMSSSTELRVGKTAGMEKYTPYRDRFVDVTADTEIAVFEEQHGASDKYQRPVRSDRIPSM